MSSSILNRVQMFLAESNKGSVKISDAIIEKFGKDCVQAFKKQFTDKRDPSFRVRMSNIGRPLCQLQMEKRGIKGEGMPYHAKMRNLFGDLIEAAAVAVMSAAGIEIQAEQKRVKYKFNGDSVEGQFDVKIEDKIWDIKSTSQYSFDNKFGENGGFDAIYQDDAFGYVAQGFLYAKADDSKFGGWIAINKSTGEWTVTETPLISDVYEKEAIDKAKESIHAVNSNKKFKRCFEDENEYFNKRPTGNKVLGRTCSYCPYKKACWGDGLKYAPQQQSQAKNPKWLWYTEILNPKVEDNA